MVLALGFILPVLGVEKKSVGASASVVSVTNLRTERMQNPLSIDTPEPRLGWQIKSDRKDVMQVSYHILVASTAEKAQNLEGDLWNAVVNSDQSQWVKYAGQEPGSNTPCFWRVKVNTTQGESDWSDVAMWNVGLLHETDWSGYWIGLDKAMPWDVEDAHSRLSSRYLRTEFTLDKEVKRAMLYICGLGMYEAYLNGKKVGEQVLAPAPTDYRKTVLYNAFDVTDKLNDKDNAIGVALGNGRFYTMQQQRPNKIPNFGYPRLRANLIIEYADGEQQVLSTDTSWKLSADGPIRSNNEYDGEIYDARKEFKGWTEIGFDDSAWQDAECVDIPVGTSRGAMNPNMKVVRTLKPLCITKRQGGFLVDMGQNMTGWLNVCIHGVLAGDSVILRFAETLTPDGNLYRANFRSAHSTDYYVADGTENGRWWAPTFVTHGFRYAEINGLQDLTADDLVGEVVSDEMEQTGTFECGDTILNKVFHNALWGVLGNYKGMPLDCPQRDERQPWLGDRARGCFGEAYLFDNNSLYAKWVRDIAESQREDGCIPDVAPAYWNDYTDNITWPSAFPFSLEMLYTQYGDEAPLRNYYLAVKRWLEHMKNQYGEDGLMPRDMYGDWCVPPEEPTLIHSKDPARITDGTLMATAYYYRLNRLMAQFAQVLGKDSDADEFVSEAARTKDAFNKKFLHPDSMYYDNNTVTANLLPLAFGMIDDESVKEVVEKNIIHNILTRNAGHISCGVIGVQWLMHGLSDMGRGDIAWLLATNKTYPSWGYMTEQGATTVWELWNGDTADPSMNSGNHVMLLGDLVSWIFEEVAGIRPDNEKPGFKHFLLKPDFTIAENNDIRASYQSLYGTIVSRWKTEGGKLAWHVEIPANTTAELGMPDGTVRYLGSGVYDF